MKHPKRRANILYNLRKKGVRCDSYKRTIYLPFGTNLARQPGQVARLCTEFNFVIQFEIN